MDNYDQLEEARMRFKCQTFWSGMIGQTEFEGEAREPKYV